MNEWKLVTSAPDNAPKIFGGLLKESDTYYEYRSPNGTLFACVKRIDEPQGKKVFYPYTLWESDGKVEWRCKGLPKGIKWPLYQANLIAKYPQKIIIFCEGEKAVDAAQKLFPDCIATTNQGGANACSRTDFSLLKNRDIIIWRDADDSGKKHEATVIDLCQQAGANSIKTADVDALGFSNGYDAADFLDEQRDPKTILQNLIEVNSLQVVTDLSPIETNNDALKQSEVLLSFLKDVTFFHDEKRQAFAEFNVNRHVEIWPLYSRNFKAWLSHLYWVNTQKPIGKHAIDEALSVMEGRALYEGKIETIFLRVGYLGDIIYIDLIDAEWRVIEVSSEGWKILEKSPVKFRRMESMRSLPVPVEHGNIEALWDLLNIDEDSQLLVLAWMLECFRPHTPFPVLVLSGLQGSAKSHTQNVIRNFIDPNVSNLRNPPKKADDLPIDAANNYLVSYNNVSHLSAHEQDDLCCMATGGGFARRRLYETEEEAVTNIQRPVIMNGIGDFITRPDLIDRAIVLELPRVIQNKRKTESELQLEFKKQSPIIFSGLLDLLVKAFNTLPKVKHHQWPRMADFAKLGCALAQVLGKSEDAFLEKYEQNRQTNVNSALESSPIILSIIQLIESHGAFHGSLATLLERLTRLHGLPNKTGWPTSAKGLSEAIKRHMFGLEINGIGIERDPQRRKDGFHIHLYKIEKQVH